MAHYKNILFEYIEAIFIAIVLTLVVTTYAAQAYEIPSGSMIPTLLVGDRVFVDKITYKFRTPKRGEVVVFKSPDDKSIDYIKRVIGLPGDRLEIKNRKVYINGKEIDENSYAYHKLKGTYIPLEPRDDFGPIAIPQNKYFVMGDNRENSFDSRFWGLLNENHISGKAIFILWSLDSDRVFPLSLRWDRFGYLL